MTTASDYLDTHQIPYRLFRHTGKVDSLEQAAAQRNQQPDQIVRSLVFRLGADEFVLVLMAGPRQVSWPALRRYLGHNRLTMANPQEVQAATGYVPGIVSPFGLLRPLRILVDRSVLTWDEISLGSGERGLALILKREDLLRGLETQGKIEVGEWGAN